MARFSDEPDAFAALYDDISAMPIHQCEKVQAVLAQYPRILVYNFPASAPKLDPVEFVWTQMEEYLARACYELLRSSPYMETIFQKLPHIGIMRLKSAMILGFFTLVFNSP